MVGGLEPLVVFWTGWGIHIMVVVSFMVQVTLLLLADIRRRKDWAWLKVVIWSAYMLADTTAIYALGHMSVVCRSPEHHLMALWAPLLLVHLGGQDNITAYAIEDNQLWLRHLQTSVLQVAAAGYVLYVSSILSHPMSSKVGWAAMLMFVVGVLKYGERIWALNRGNSNTSSSLSATSYDNKVSVSRTVGYRRASRFIDAMSRITWSRRFISAAHNLAVAYSLLHAPKQMLEGPTSYVQNISNVVFPGPPRVGPSLGNSMFRVVEMQLWMMYDLLYTKAAVVHTWYGLCSRVLVSLPFTVAALLLFHSSPLVSGRLDAAAAVSRADVAITNVLLSGAVALETMSVLRAIFSKWTAVLLLQKEWSTLASLVFAVETGITLLMAGLLQSGEFWSGRMQQHNLFKLRHHSGYSMGSRIAKRLGMEDWWDSKAYSWSMEVPELAIEKVLKLVSSTTVEGITRSWGKNALQKSLNNNKVLVTWIWTEEVLKLEERILVWHITTHLYISWYNSHATTTSTSDIDKYQAVREAAEALADYMFFLLAARPYMLPYPVSRQTYVQLCSDAVTHFPRDCTESKLLEDILRNHKALLEGNPLGGPNKGMNSTLDRGCQLVAKLIHITATEAKRVDGKDIIVKRANNGKGIIIAEQAETSGNGMEEAETTFSVNGEVILDMLLEVWVEMLCYTAYMCNEKSHAKHLTDGGEIMTIITLLMIYMKNDLVEPRL